MLYSLHRQTLDFYTLITVYIYISSQAWNSWNEKSIRPLIDPIIFQPQHEKEIMRCVHVGLLCVQEFAKDRPDIPTVIAMLYGEISDLPYPNRPGFTFITHDTISSEQNSTKNYISVTEISGR